MNPTIAGLCVLAALDALWSLLQLFRLTLSTYVSQAGLDDSSSRTAQRPQQVLRDTVAGAYPGRYRRYSVGVRLCSLARDVECAREQEKQPFGTAIPRNPEPSDPKPLCSGDSTWLPLLRSLTGILLLAPACMLLMSNYAVTRGLLRGCSRFEFLPLGHQISLVPQYALRPSPLVFFSASIIWTLLEYVHYQSNAEDDYQKRFLCVASVIGLLPCIACSTSSALGTLVFTMPWIIHSGLLISDLLHRTGVIDLARPL